MKSQRRSVVPSVLSTAALEQAARRARYEAAHIIRRCASASPLRLGASTLVRDSLTSCGARLRSDEFADQRRRLVAEITALDSRDADGERPIDAYLRRLDQGLDAEKALDMPAGTACKFDAVFEDAPIDGDTALVAAALGVLRRLATSSFDVFQVITDVRDGVALVRPIADPRVSLHGFGGQAGAIEVAIADLVPPQLGGIIAGHLQPALPGLPLPGRATEARISAMARFSTSSLVFRPGDRQAVRTICAVHADSDVATLRAALFALYVSLEVEANHEDDLDTLAGMSSGSLIALWPHAQLLRCADREALIDALFDHLCDELESIDDDGAFLLTATPTFAQIDLVFDDGEIWLRGHQGSVEQYAARLMALPGVELEPIDVLESVQDIESLDASLLQDAPS